MRKLLLTIFLFCPVIFSGCVSNQPNYDKDVKISHQYLWDFAKVKDPTKYKPLFEKEIAYFQPLFFSDQSLKHLRASVLRRNYEYLFVLETIIGNKYQAEVYFRKAQYWSLICAESLIIPTPLTPKELAERSKITKTGIINLITKVDSDFVRKVEAMAKAEKDKKSALESRPNSLQKN